MRILEMAITTKIQPLNNATEIENKTPWNTQNDNKMEKNHDDNENDKGKDKKCLKTLLKPILFCMALSGCYNFSDIYYKHQSENKKVTKLYVFSMTYRIMTLVLLILVLTKYIVTGFHSPEYEIMTISSTIWASLIVAILLVNFKQTSTKYGHYKQAFKLWEEKIIPGGEELGMECPVDKIKHRVIIVSIVAMAFAILNTVAVGLMMTIHAGEFYLYPFEDTWWSRMLILAVSLLASLTWTIPQANAAVLCKSLSAVFISFNKFFKQTIMENNGTFPPNFKKMQILHLNLCKLVEELDSDFGLFFATDIGFSILLCLFVLYQMIKITMDTVSFVSFGFWFASGIAIISIASIFSAQTNILVC